MGESVSRAVPAADGAQEGSPRRVLRSTRFGEHTDIRITLHSQVRQSTKPRSCQVTNKCTMAQIEESEK